MAKNPNTPHRHPPHPRPAHVRRGSIYISVLGVSMLVLVIGVGAVTVGRIQARAANAASDFAEARLCARSGLELAMLAVYNDPYWRTNRGNGAWFTNSPVGAGTFSLSAADPVDNDVTLGDNNPVVLTSTGTRGSSRYVMSMRMEVGAATGSCLEAALCASKALTITGAALTCDQTIRSNTTVNATGGSTVNTPMVEATTSITGSGYNGSTVVTGKTSTLPDSATVLDYYTANGTVIPYTSLRQTDGEIVANGSFESSANGWYPINGCLLQRSTFTAKDGTSSLRVYNRDSAADSAATDLNPAAMLPGHSYDLACSVYPLSAMSVRATLTLSTNLGTFSLSTPLSAMPANTWTDLKITGTLPATGWTTVTTATLSVESNSTSNSYYVDAVSFKDSTYGTAYMMDGKLLTPTANPYGSANSKGIYIINCSGRDVIVADSRIIGTLVLQNPGLNTALRGSVVIEPPTANFPALMTDGKITIGLSSAALNEGPTGLNFNPPGAPYPYQSGAGTFTNATTTDVYPSAINGLVYAKDDLTIDNNTSINGVVVGAGLVKVNATSLTLRYNNYYLNNPPPGFTAGTIQMKPVPGTWQRVSN